MKNKKLNGAEIVINCLLEQNTEVIFGYPGGTILNIYDELYKNGKIKHVLTSHEQGAAHAADGYARATGKVGVCFATSGPGATNLVTGLATAYMDSVPMVAITCNVARSLLGKDSFQEVDISGITMPITKHNYIVSDVSELADVIRESFYIASSGRPGPVLIDIPKDVTAQEYEYAPKKPYAVEKNTVATIKDVNIAVEAINAGSKPLIMIGGGVISSDATGEIAELAGKLNCPVITTLMGIGGYDSKKEEYLGMVGMHGTKASNVAVNSCDTLIAVGVRFSDRVVSNANFFAKNAKIIHVDVDKAEISKNIPAYIGLVGDAKEVITRILPLVKAKTDDEWLNKCVENKQFTPVMDSENAPLNPQFIMKTVHELTSGEAIITTEVGQNQMWASQYYSYDTPRTLITSGGLGTMGFGTGASIGAQIGRPDKRVVAIAGDGSFRMNCNELSTVAYYDVPAIYVILNNGTLGMVRQWQTLFYGERYSQTTLDRGPDFVKLAEAYGIKGARVETKQQFVLAMQSALSENKPMLIDAKINIDEFVLPMVGPGQPISNQRFTGKDEK